MLQLMVCLEFRKKLSIWPVHTRSQDDAIEISDSENIIEWSVKIKNTIYEKYF